MAQKIAMCPTCKVPEGVMKPDIVFFGEQLPERFHDCVKNDREACDLVLVMGSSLEVAPVKMLPALLNDQAPAVLLNR